MGRYYNGDIEGKFWFGVQDSDDAEFFGASVTQPHYLDCYADDINAISKGIAECLDALGDNKQKLDDFFNGIEHGYNDEMIIDYYKRKHDATVTENDIRKMLKWYARLELGQKMFDCVKQKGDCSFTAEL